MQAIKKRNGDVLKKVLNLQNMIFGVASHEGLIDLSHVSIEREN